MSTRYYTENLAKIRYKHLKQALAPTAGPLAGLMAGGLRLAFMAGVRLPAAHGDGFPGSERTIDPAELPSAAVAKWAPILEQLRDLGFEPLRTCQDQTVGAKLHFGTTLYNPTGNAVAILEWTRMAGAGGFEENTPLELNAYIDGGPDIVTGVVRRQDIAMADLVQIESAEIVSFDNRRPLGELYAQHRERCAGKDVIAVGEENVEALVDARARQRFDELLQSGLLRELSPDEVKRLAAADVGELHDC